MNLEEKICSIPSCTFKGKPQPISSFHIKSRTEKKVYRDKRCASCAKKLKATKKSKRIITSNKERLADRVTHKGSRVNYEFFPTASDDSILKSYNESVTDHKIKADEFNDITKAVLTLFKIEEQLNQIP